MRTAGSFTHLLAPGRIGALETRNRIVMAPMGSNLAEPSGHAGERIKRYYEEQARGGAGLIIVGVGAIAHPAGACIPNQVAISDDAFLPGLQELTGRIHAAGARAAIQLQHAGKVATQDIAAGRPMRVPSDLPIKAGDLFDDLTAEETQSMTSYLARPGAQVAFHEMSAADIRQLVVRFADAAEPQTLPADSVILATGTGENRHLGDTIAALGFEVHFLGDCARLGYVEGAIADAARVAGRI